MSAPYDLEQLLVTVEGLIGPDIYRKTVNTSPYLKLVKQDAWPDEMGSSIKVLTYERSLPYNSNTLEYQPNTWSDVGNNTQGTPSGNEQDGDNGGNCLPSKNTVKFGQSTVSYNIQQTALESPDICVNDLRFPVYRKQQLANIMSILTENTSYMWVERFRDEYIRLAGHKVIAKKNGSGIYIEDDEWTNTAPVSQLTQGLLKRLYMKLIRDGGGNNPLDRENARPVFGLICSSETSENLIMNNEALRTDIRYSSKVNDLLAPLGVERSYGGFFHLIDDFAPRYNFTAGAWVRVYPYKAQSATKGKKMEINPAYETALYEDSIIFHPEVFTNMVPKPITNPGGGVSFDPVEYRGTFKWLNIQDREHNPDKTIGFFRGVFQAASKPIRPEFGYVIRHLRCDIPADEIGCS